MAVEIIGRPRPTGFDYDLDIDLTIYESEWNAVRNPIVYVFESSGISLLTNYRIEVEVFDAVTDTSLTGITLSSSPNSSGITYIDVSSMLSKILTAELELSTLTLSNQKENYTSKKFYIKYQELYTGSATSVVDDVANPVFAVLAGLQIPSESGGNMIEYTPDIDFVRSFLTVAELNMWMGFPFSVSFIYSEAILDATVKETFYDASGATLLTTTSSLVQANNEYINRLVTGIVSNENANSLLLEIQVDSVAVLSETIAIKQVCSNPVYLFWKNSVGGDVWWMFSNNQELSYNVSNSRKNKRMLLFAENLTLPQWQMIDELNSIGEIFNTNIVQFTGSTNKNTQKTGNQVYVVDASGNKVGVTVIPSSATTLTKNVSHSISIEIEYPYLF